MTAAADQLHLTSSQQKSVHTRHLSCMRRLPDCQGEKQRQETALPVTRSAAEASRVPEKGAQASLISTKMILFQRISFCLLTNCQ